MRIQAVAFRALLLSALVLGQPTLDPTAAGRNALDLLLAGKYAEFNALLTDSAKGLLTSEFLRDRVGAELKSFGTLGGVGEPVKVQEGKNSLITFPVRFSETSVNIQITLNDSLQVAAFHLHPGNAPLPPGREQPAYSKPDSFHAREVTIGDDDWKLGGTLLVPAGKPPFPGVVLVHGPGPNDRDESIYSNQVFRDLAEGLASRGIAVLRYDKRTKVYGERMSEIDFTLQQETVEDAVRAAALMRQQPEIDPDSIFVLGHSLGGYASPRIAAQDGSLAGLIFLAANARPIEDVALEQNDYVAHLNGGPSADVQKRLDSLKEEVAKVKQLDPGKPNPPVVLGLPVGYLLDLKGYDAAGQAKGLAIPMLFLQGERDFQVTMTDFGIWKSAMSERKDVTFHSYPKLNYLFITGERKSSPTEYRTPGNVDAEVVGDIATWVLARKK
jgi:dienelactone hydrolase